MDAVILLKVARGHAQKVVTRPGHQMALENVVEIANGLLEAIHRFPGLAGQRDLHKDFDCQAEFSRREPCTIARDDARLFECLDPPMAGRGGERYLLGKFRDRKR